MLGLVEILNYLWPEAILIVLAVFIASVVLVYVWLREEIKAWWKYDVMFDLVPSFADEVISLVTPFDVGDWGGAIVTYLHHKKVMGTVPALFAAGKVAGFGIESLLGVTGVGGILGFVIGGIFNVIPGVAAIRKYCSKDMQVQKEMAVLDAEKRIIEKAGGHVHGQVKDAMKEMHHLLRKDWPLDADKIYTYYKPEKKLHDEAVRDIRERIERIEAQRQAVLQDPLFVAIVDGDYSMLDPQDPAAPAVVEGAAVLAAAIARSSALLEEANGLLAAFTPGFVGRLLRRIPDPKQAEQALDKADEALQVVSDALQKYTTAIEMYNASLA